jgi:hypothetical protein
MQYRGEMAVLGVLGRYRGRSALFSLLVMMVQDRLHFIVAGNLNLMGWFKSSVCEKLNWIDETRQVKEQIPWNPVVMRWDC